MLPNNKGTVNLNMRGHAAPSVISLEVVAILMSYKQIPSNT